MKRTLKRLHDPEWLVLPDDVEARITAWRRGHPKVRFDELRGRAGLPVHAITLTDPAVPEGEKKVLFFQQPHGHEPAQTAGAMEVLSELITGRTLDGRRTGLDVPRLLGRLVVIINPLGNPEGRSRLPHEVFDDSFTFLEGAYYWNGKLRGDEWYFNGGGRFAPSAFDLDPDYPIGLRYEQVGEDLFSDPWNDPAATLGENPTTMARLARTILDRHHVDAIVDLHQYPEQDAVMTFTVEVPDRDVMAMEHLMAQRIEDDWARDGFHVCWRQRWQPDAPSGRYLWTLYNHGTACPPMLTVEVGGGVGFRNAVMSRRVQGSACASAIRSVLRLYAGL